MVVIGGITRLTGSGLSITEWKIVTGTFPPLSELSWQKEFDAYKKIPQYKLINSDFTLHDFKHIYFWEYLHRLIGRIIGIVFLIPFLWFLIQKKIPTGFLPKIVLLFALGGFQGFLGWFMVKSGLSENIHVSHYRLAVHLISAFTVFGFTYWFGLDLFFAETSSVIENKKIKRYAYILLVTVILQIIYGAFVAGLKAGYGYPTWPKMGNVWFPFDEFVLEPFWKNFTEGHAGVQFIHRYLAYIVTGITGILFYHGQNLPSNTIVKKAINFLLILVLSQFILGVITLLFGVPILIATLHQTGAFFIFGVILLILHRIR